MWKGKNFLNLLVVLEGCGYVQRGIIREDGKIIWVLIWKAFQAHTKVF